jgi:hypothetical protein
MIRQTSLAVQKVYWHSASQGDEPRAELRNREVPRTPCVAERIIHRVVCPSLHRSDMVVSEDCVVKVVLRREM